MSSDPSPSFRLRALLAVGLMAGFYLLASGVVVTLASLIYLDVAVGHRVHLKLLLVAGLGIFGVVRGCFFVSDRFEPPGPELLEADQPALFAAIREVARKMGAELPSAVYLFPDVNAFVSEVGGYLGMFGTRRVMGIGVGLLSADSVAQLKATIAHEFGHFSGGDTRLGAFLFRTRASIGRVVGSLGDSWLSKPFEWYGTMFLRITLGIARRQELAADGCSLLVAGRAAHVDGLRREAVAGSLFQTFLRNEVSPLLDEGLAPKNLFVGFRTFLGNLGADGALVQLETELGKEQTDPYDSHPALPERIAWAEQQPATQILDEPAPAHTLLADRDRVEEELTATMIARAAPGGGARLIGWEELPAIYAGRMARAAGQIEKSLGAAAVSVATLVDGISGTDRVGLARRIAPGAFAADGTCTSSIPTILFHFTFAMLGDQLVKSRGCRWDTAPGRPVQLLDAGGAVLPLRSLLLAAAEDPTRAGPLRDWLATQGIEGDTRAAC